MLIVENVPFKVTTIPQVLRQQMIGFLKPIPMISRVINPI